MLNWGGKKWRPGGSRPQPNRINQSVSELMKPLGEKSWQGNVWGSVIMNVQKGEEPTPPTPTPTPSATPSPAFDPDAAVYLQSIIDNSGTLNPTISAATNTLFTQLKSNGLYDKIDAFYPILGGISGTTRLNGKRSLSIYDLTYYGGWSFSYSGHTPNGLDAYANTNWSITTPYINNNSFGAYLTSLDITTAFEQYETDLGLARTSSGNYWHAGIKWGSTNDSRGFNGTQNIFAPLPSTNGGFIVNSRIGNTDVSLYLNGVLSYTNTNTNTSNNSNGDTMYLGSMNWDLTAKFFSPRNQVFAYMGQGLTQTEVGQLYTIVETFETTLGRSVIPTPTPTATPVTPTPTPTPSATPSAFSPASLSGGIYYNNYTDSSKMVLDTSGGQTTIASVIDGFTGSTIFSQSTKSFQPLYVNHNGKNTAVAIPNISSGLLATLNLPGEYTIFVIVDNVSGSSSNFMFSIADDGASWGNQTSGRHHQFKIVGTQLNYAIGFDAPGNPTLPNTTIAQGTGWDLIVMRNRVSGGNMITEIFNNSSTPVATDTIAGTPSSFSNKGVVVASKGGDSGSSYIPIAEQGMYNRALTDGEITQLVNYFTSNY